MEKITEVVIDRKVLGAFKRRALKAYPNEILEQVVGKMAGPQARIFAYSDGLRLEKPAGNWTLRYKSRSEEVGEIVATLLGAVMR